MASPTRQFPGCDIAFWMALKNNSAIVGQPNIVQHERPHLTSFHWPPEQSKVQVVVYWGHWSWCWLLQYRPKLQI